MCSLTFIFQRFVSRSCFGLSFKEEGVELTRFSVQQTTLLNAKQFKQVRMTATQAAGAMHDGAKRRLVADAADGDAPSEWEQVSAVSAPSYAGKVRMDDTLLEEALVAALDASPVIGAASQLEKEDDNELPVDLPPGVDSLSQWGRTMMSFGQYKGKYCYHEIASGASFWDYKKWVRTHVKPGSSKGAALDFAAYLRAYDKEHGCSQLPVFPGTSIPRQYKKD